jgi:hypothetical protein
MKEIADERISTPGVALLAFGFPRLPLNSGLVLRRSIRPRLRRAPAYPLLLMVSFFG